jgi:hypothetical protein
MRDSVSPARKEDMQPAIEIVSGTPCEMGRQQGQIFRHVIHANMQQWAMRHDFQGSDDYLDEKLATRRSANQTIAPWIEGGSREGEAGTVTRGSLCLRDLSGSCRCSRQCATGSAFWDHGRLLLHPHAATVESR